MKERIEAMATKKGRQTNEGNCSTRHETLQLITTMKPLLTSILLILLLAVSVSPQSAAPKTAVVLERTVAQAIWVRGTGESEATFEAIKHALRNRRSLEEAGLFLVKRCRDSCGDGPLDQCTRQFVMLELPESVAVEWLVALTTERRLSEEAGVEIERVFRGLKLDKGN